MAIDSTNVKAMLKKLFAVAENDASTDGEIENAMRAASILMHKHQIERDDVFETEDGEVHTDNIAYDRGYRYSRYQAITSWESLLLKFITEFVPGTGYYIQKGVIRRNSHGMATGGRATQFVIYGPSLDVQFALDIFDEVVVFLEAAARLRYGKALARGAAAAYAEGFARALCEANKKEVQKLEQAHASDCMSLMVVNRTLAIKKAGKQWLADEHDVRLSKSRGARSQAMKDFDAYAQGQADGKNYKPGAKKKAGYLT